MAFACGTGDDDSSTSADGETGADATSADSGTTGDVGDGGDDGGLPAGCDGMGLGPGDYDRNFMWDGENRRYKIHVPPGYDGTTPTPLIVNFHGFGSDAGQQIFFSQMNDTADVDGYLVVYPQGLQNADSSQSWNAGSCCADDLARDDVGFTREMLDRLEASLCVDRSRVYSTGMSNGGFMTNLLACEAGDVFAAFSPVAGALGVPTAQCNPASPVPIMVMNGTADSAVPYASGEATAEFFAQTNGCGDTRSVTFQQGVVTCEGWDGCPAGGEVVLCRFEGVAHCWPGQPFCLDGDSTEDAHANDLMWEFFSGYALP